MASCAHCNDAMVGRDSNTAFPATLTFFTAEAKKKMQLRKGKFTLAHSSKLQSLMATETSRSQSPRTYSQQAEMDESYCGAHCPRHRP